MNQTMQIEHQLDFNQAGEPASKAYRRTLAGTLLTSVGFAAASGLAGSLVLAGLLAIGYAGHFLPEIRPLAFVWAIAGLFLAGAASAAVLRRGLRACLSFGLGFLLAGVLFPAMVALNDVVVPGQLDSAVRMLAVIVPACALACGVAGAVGLAGLAPRWSVILFASACFGLLGSVGGAVALVPCIMEMGELAMVGGVAAGSAMSIFLGGMVSVAISDRFPLRRRQIRHGFQEE